MSSTNRRWGVAFVVAAAIAIAPVAYGLARLEHQPPHGSAVGEVALDENVLLTPDLIRAFVPTGSKSHRCLVTFAESTIGDALGPAPFCGPRTVDGVNGVLITINLEEEVADLYLSLTVFQQFSKGYGPPVLYRGI